MKWILYARFQTKNDRNSKNLNDVFEKLRTEIDNGSPSKVRIDEVSNKKELLECILDIQKKDIEISEWYFIGHGMPYGPIMGSIAWPEEISPYEWRNIKLPFSQKAKAWFYIRGSENWLAPFIATTFSIHCFSISEKDFSVKKAFPPGVWNNSADYNPIASLYAETFSDISVRRDECRWIEDTLKKQPFAKILDIGCGNGALLSRLSPKIKLGAGVDISSEAIKIARRDNVGKNLSFHSVDRPALPFDDNSFEVVLSMLSFRYLDWDPILQEMKRVLTPGGRILIVDMVASSTKPYQLPSLTFDKLKNLWYQKKNKDFAEKLHKLVTHPDWLSMLKRNPMRLQSEFIWYLKSRFPEGKFTVLNTGLHAKILAFDSGSVN